MSPRRLACALLFAVIGGSGFVESNSRPDLVVWAVSVSQHAHTLQVDDVVRNLGGGPAAASSTQYYLARRRIGARPVRPLPLGAVSSASTKLTIPTFIRPGSWRLRACADARDRVRESNERNNCRFAVHPVVVGDVTPPHFAGLERATTCIPGPVGGTTRYTPYGLRWQPASDNATPAAEIVYDIYEAPTSGGEDFSKPSYTTAPGATSYVTPPLPDDVPHYFVVRARDQAGNRDGNKVERLGVNLCV